MARKPELGVPAAVAAGNPLHIHSKHSTRAVHLQVCSKYVRLGHCWLPWVVLVRHRRRGQGAHQGRPSAVPAADGTMSKPFNTCGLWQGATVNMDTLGSNQGECLQVMLPFAGYSNSCRAIYRSRPMKRKYSRAGGTVVQPRKPLDAILLLCQNCLQAAVDVTSRTESNLNSCLLQSWCKLAEVSTACMLSYGELLSPVGPQGHIHIVR